MSVAKRLLEEQEEKRHNQLEGYRKHLYKENTYDMDCPYCCNALSYYDSKQEQCLHCGYYFKWNPDN